MVLPTEHNKIGGVDDPLTGIRDVFEFECVSVKMPLI